MDEEEAKNAVVIDIGSGLSKVGFAGDDLPRSVFPSIVGKHRYESNFHGTPYRGFYVGDEAYRRYLVTIHHPIERGVVTNWDYMERIWHHAFYNELRIDPEEHPVLLCESVLNPKRNRERMTQIMFETFRVPGLYIAYQPLLSLHATGRNTGVVLESGDGVTISVPIYAGYCLPHGIQHFQTLKLLLAGRDLTSYMIKLLKMRGYSFETASDIAIVNDIKEKYSYVAPDVEEELQYLGNNVLVDQEYELPDGNAFPLNEEIFRCPEALFNPSLLYKDAGNGIHEMVHNSIIATNPNIFHELYENIVLGGGCTLFKGIGDRLEKEIIALATPRFKVNVISPPERKYSAWLGGSILASSKSFERERSARIGGSILASHLANTSNFEMWMTKEEYEESGPIIVHWNWKVSDLRE